MEVSTNAAYILHLERCLGITKYRWAACHDDNVKKTSVPSLADCSGFTSWGYHQVGLNFTTTAAGFLALCKSNNAELSVLEASKIRGAHLILINPSGANHIATVIAPNWMIHCTSQKGGVWIERISDRGIHWTHGGILLP